MRPWYDVPSQAWHRNVGLCDRDCVFPPAVSPQFYEHEISRFDAVPSANWHAFTIRNRDEGGGGGADAEQFSPSGGRPDWWGTGAAAAGGGQVAFGRVRGGVVEAMLAAPTRSDAGGEYGLRLEFSGERTTAASYRCPAAPRSLCQQTV